MIGPKKEGGLTMIYYNIFVVNGLNPGVSVVV